VVPAEHHPAEIVPQLIDAGTPRGALRARAMRLCRPRLRHVKLERSGELETGTVPGATDDVWFPDNSNTGDNSAGVVNVPDGTTVQSLNLEVSTAIVTLQGSLNVSDVDLSAGQIAGPGRLNAAGAFEWYNGLISNMGVFIGGEMDVLDLPGQPDVHSLQSARITNQGVIADYSFAGILGIG
jgi:hypothetical protein